MTGERSDVLQAALRGDVRTVDEAEISYLNLLVRIGEFGVRYPDGEPHEIFGPGRSQANVERRAFVLHIVRAGGHDGRSLLVWTLAEPCRRCERFLRRRPCNVCGGHWYVDRGQDLEWLVYSDTDGVLVKDDLG